MWYNFHNSTKMRNMVDPTYPTPGRSGRDLLARVAARARPLIRVAEAASALGWDATRTAKQLSRWNQQGLLRRIRRGVYAVVPPAAYSQQTVVSDPWVLVPATFRRAYVAGWSAAEHWDLTEQVFTTLLVCTTDALKRTRNNVAGVTLQARHIPDRQFFGTTVVWREGTRVLISDIHKTIVDMFDSPALGGGIQHVTECFSAYLHRDDRDLKRLLDYMGRLQSASAFKRMGFITEFLRGPVELREACLSHVTLGLAKLDTSIESPRVNKRWQLRLPGALERLLPNG